MNTIASAFSDIVAQFKTAKNQSFIDMWLTMLEGLQSELPQGSGFDSGSTIDIDSSRPNKLVFLTAFHHMDESGFYDGWTNHKVIVTPDFRFGLDLQITGNNRNNIKEYIGDCFHEVLGRKIKTALCDGEFTFSYVRED